MKEFLSHALRLTQNILFIQLCFHDLPNLTFIAISHSAKVNIVLVIGEEKETEPRVNSINGHNEQDPDDVALLIGATVTAQVHVDLDEKKMETRIRDRS